MAKSFFDFVNSADYARKMDREDQLRDFRKQFHLPSNEKGPVIYLIGNSLGLQPKRTKQYIKEELDDWATLAGEGHTASRRPWLYYHKFSKKILAELTGSKTSEVVAMNQLTVNLHLMMVSFYRPDGKRYKILCEKGAFSSDQYAFESQLRFHGIDPKDGLLEVEPRRGEYTIRTEDILETIRAHGDSIALVILGAVQYYTGQFFEIKKITTAAHEAGAIAGFDLAHAIGNVPLQLHKDNVDFAVWCSYKYLNSGPGAIAGAFVHERHAKDHTLPRFAGWWGHDEKERFKMLKGFIPMEGIDGWQVSNVPILQSAAHLASLEIFKDAGMKRLRSKSVALTGFLEFCLNEIDPTNKKFITLTPRDPAQRGCQLSLYVMTNGKKVFSRITRAGVMADWREPNVIRVAPAPLYNTFEEVFRFGEIFKQALHD